MTMIATKKLRPPLKWHGGKSYLARRIIALMPEHFTYAEPFLGGGSVLLNKVPAKREIVGDTDKSLINFWQELQWPMFDNRIIQGVSEVEYNKWYFDRALEARRLGELTPDVDAYTFLVANRFSRGGLGKAFAWSERQRGGRPGDANAWETIKAELPTICLRIRNVRIMHLAALDLIAACDAPGTLFYCDPPYLHSTRTVKKAYRHEMTVDQHEKLLDALGHIRGKFLLSGYPSPLYAEAARVFGWHSVEFDLPNHSGQGKAKQRRREVVWANYPLETATT